MTERKDYYKILGVDKNATEDEIKKQYKKLAIQFHPDKFATESEEKRKEAEEKFKDINEAYSVLSDKDKRAQYDNPMPEGFPHGFGFGFNPFGQQGHQQRINVGTDIKLNIKVSIEEAYNGILKKLKFKKKVHCPDCNGTGSKDGKEKVCPHCGGTGMFREESRNGAMFYIKQYPCPHCGGTGQIVSDPCKKCNGSGLVDEEVIEEIDVPAGVFTNAALTMNGHGNMPKGDGVPGNLYIVFIVNDDEYYKMSGNNNGDVMHYEYVPFNEALLGCEREIKLLDGTTKKIKLEENCPDGKSYKFTGKGMPLQLFGYNGNGNLNVIIKYKYPNKLTEEQKNVLKQFKW